MKVNLCLPRSIRHCVFCFIGLFIIEIAVFQCVALYTILQLLSLREIVSSGQSGGNLVDNLAGFPVFRKFVSAGKDGHFVGILQETLERLYIESYETQPVVGLATSELKRADQLLPLLQFIGLDVSSAGEALYLYRRMQQGPRKNPWCKLVVDIGSNDGLMSSNSFNFIKWGWSAVLVEPQPQQNHLARRNLNRYIDPFKNGSQSVSFVEGIVGEKDGNENFVLSGDIVQMESHVLAKGQTASSSEKVIKVKSYSVKKLAEKYNIPKQFGLLSIDAEGSSAVILRQWIDQGFRPAYVIYEHIHEREHHTVTIKFMESHGYKFLTKRHWNLLFENIDLNTSIDGGAGV